MICLPIDLHVSVMHLQFVADVWGHRSSSWSVLKWPHIILLLWLVTQYDDIFFNKYCYDVDTSNVIYYYLCDFSHNFSHKYRSAVVTSNLTNGDHLAVVAKSCVTPGTSDQTFPCHGMLIFCHRLSNVWFKIFLAFHFSRLTHRFVVYVSEASPF